MTTYYKDGFYSDDMGAEIPEGAVEISDEEHLALLEGQAEGKRIVFNEKLQKPVLAEPEPVTLSELKATKLAEINRKAQAFVAEVAHLNDTPEFEQQTWQEQANEARAWYADNNMPTPKLDLLAKIRGIPVNTLRQKAYEKAVAYYNLSFVVMGQRQAYEDKLKKAKTIEAVLAISPEYTVEF